jgi:hypothetical protein
MPRGLAFCIAITCAFDSVGTVSQNLDEVLFGLPYAKESSFLIGLGLTLFMAYLALIYTRRLIETS